MCLPACLPACLPLLQMVILEDENMRLKERNKVLETLHGASDAAAAAAAGAPAMQHSTSVRFHLPPDGAILSPSLTISPRVSDANQVAGGTASGSGASPTGSGAASVQPAL